ncbi:hypothetical protein [Endozoicomonas sp. SESOKO1]|uniref:hypothetical protein n=1 Tax=Endozoicomonas sp. SESOKO1 TaxID=2828742 RepID=UPI0021476760|nr:hypothetical protein [Endozoicomonas sp. SESOKO1]
MQGFILKAIAPTHPKPAGRVDQQAASGRPPESSRVTFNGKKVSNHQFHRDRANTRNDGKRIENAFWEKQPLYGHLITSAGVLTAYGNDKTSLRAGFFLQKLCLQNILHGNQKVTPEQVIQEFNREPDQNHKCKLAIARFKAECCLRGLPLNGQQVTPGAVVKGYQTARAALELARFKEQCCLRGLPLAGQQVTTDEVAREYQEIRAILELARFKEKCFQRGLSLNGQQVTPDAVVRNFQAVKAMLELARFKELCCLRGKALNGQQVTPEAVIQGYQAVKAKLEPIRFKAECCLRGLTLNGQQVTPDMVVEEYQATRATLELARFKELCCLRGMALNGQPVTPDAVVEQYQAARATLELTRFKAECCLRGLPLHGQRVTPITVVKDYQAARATLELARFQAECCLRGLPLNGRPITPDRVVRDFPNSPEGKLGIARFKAECCLRGLPLNGQQITPAEVVKGFPVSAEGRLGIARFKEQCCLRGLSLNRREVTPDEVVKHFPGSSEGLLGLACFKEICCLSGLLLDGQQVTPDAVVKDFPDSPEGRLGIARFKQQCCLRGLLLNGQQVTADAVVKAFPDSPEGKLGVTRFKQQCCLRGLLLNGQKVTADAVIKDYERGGWLLERADFYAELALNARLSASSCLDNRIVLQAFNEAPGDHSSRQAEYLVQRLNQPQGYDDTSEAQDIMQKAWQTLNSLPVKKDEQHRLQCILKFMAMQNELAIDHQEVSAEQVLQSITTLRHSFQNLRIHFFFLAHCYITGQPIDGRQIHKSQVLECLRSFPEGSKLRHTLGSWFEQCSCEASVMDNMLFKRERADASDGNRHSATHVNNTRHDHRDPLPDVIPDIDSVGRRTTSAEVTFATQAITGSAARTLKHPVKTGGPGFVDKQVPRLNALTLKALEIIQEINGSYTAPPILITGSYSRFLQNRCSSFNDIDIIFTTEEPVKTLFEKLQTLNTGRDSEIPKSIIILPIPGCQAIRLPKAYNIHIKDGDLGMKTMELQVSIDARVTRLNAARLAVNVPGVDKPVWCLPFAEETRLLNDTLEYLADNLVPLTEQLQKGVLFDIPRTILFNTPRNTDDRIYGLLIRTLLTLNKARQFIALHRENSGKPDYLTNQLQEEQRRLHALAANLQMQLTSHVCRNAFEHRVNGWLLTPRPINKHEIKKNEFIKGLLLMLHHD